MLGLPDRRFRHDRHVTNASGPLLAHGSGGQSLRPIYTEFSGWKLRLGRSYARGRNATARVCPSFEHRKEPDSCNDRFVKFRGAMARDDAERLVTGQKPKHCAIY